MADMPADPWEWTCVAFMACVAFLGAVSYVIWYFLVGVHETEK